MTESGLQIFPALTRRSSEVWQVGAVRLPIWIAGSGGKPASAWIALCRSWDSGRMQPSNPGSEEEVPALLADALSRAARKWRFRPARVQVPEEAWAGALEALLAPEGVEVEVQSNLPELLNVLEAVRIGMAEDELRPGPLTGAGVTPERMAGLARAAADFMAASGWRYLNGEDLIRIEAPGIDPDLRFLILSHRWGRPAPYLTFFAEAEEEGSETDGEEKGRGLWLVEFLPPWGAPAEDVELWARHGLSWAGEGLLPVALFLGREALARPDSRQLALFEGIFAALAVATEEDLDAGRWETQVATSQGLVRFVLSLPELLAAEPPPGRRLALPPVEALTAGPESREEQAEDLLDLAYQAHGRGATLLARQALAVWPDCADAYNLLAVRSPDFDSAARLYEQAMAAGERAMGPEIFAEAGHFWGLIETRPYMKARQGLANIRVNQERYAEAVDHYEELLRLNPNDNQGVRDSLVSLLVDLGRNEEAWKWLDFFDEDGQALMEYPRALLRYRAEGDSLMARKALKAAVKANRFVPGMLLGTRPVPPEGDFYSVGRESEAGFYVTLSRGAWDTTAGALEWLRKRTVPPRRPGSKKKAKRKKTRR
jgi:tetratricopeptide (TPR) repeat protein